MTQQQHIHQRQFPNDGDSQQNEDEQNLIGNISFVYASSSGGPSEEEDDKQNYEEFNSLLEHTTDLKKTYDFLNNW